MSKIKFKVEYPNFVFANKDPETFDHLTIFSLHFRTCVHYFKNHDTGFEEFVFNILGFGFRLTRNS